MSVRDKPRPGQVKNTVFHKPFNWESSQRNKQAALESTCERLSEATTSIFMIASDMCGSNRMLLMDQVESLRGIVRDLERR